MRSLAPLVRKHAARIGEELEQRIREFGDPLLLDLVVEHPGLPDRHRMWLENLCEGPYDGECYRGLTRIGRIHASLHIRSHFVNVSMNIIRAALMDMLSEEVEDRAARTSLKESLNKLLDINLDIITSSYIEEELQHYSPAYRIKSTLIGFAEKFSGAMNMVLVLALVAITLGVAGLFVFDLAHLARGGLAEGSVLALGSLIVLWVLIELMNTEIAHLKGGKFNISVFIGVALVALIRDLMIVTLRKESVSFAYFLVAAILALGMVYWLVTRVEAGRKEKRE